MFEQRLKGCLARGIVLGLALLVQGGAASAQGLDSRFFNSVAEIDPGVLYSDTEGEVTAEDDEFSTRVAVLCDDGVDNDFKLSCSTLHPDKAILTQGSVRIEERDKSNLAEVRIEGLVGGHPDIDTVCSCETARQSGAIKTHNSKMSLSCDFKKCDCLQDGLTAEELESGIACFGKRKSIKGKFKKGLLDGRIKSKGVIRKAP